MTMRNNHTKVVITGIGVVSPIGIGKDAFWNSLEEGKSGIRPVTLFDVSNLKSRLAGEISNFNPDTILGSKGLRNLDRTTKLALCASKLCFEDAKFEITSENASEVGVVLGSTMGSVSSISEFDKEAIKNGPKSVNPALFSNTVMNSPASQISIRFGIKGFNTTISTGFTSSLDAIEYACNFIRLGRAKAVLVGGVEELCEQTYKGCYLLNFLSKTEGKQTELCAPFDKRRNGAILGEGAALFLLESYASAIQRNAHIYCFVGGTGFDNEYQLNYRYDTHSKGIERAIREALQESMIQEAEIDYIASSANSTLRGDVTEFRQIRNVFQTENKEILASASKSMLGDAFSAGAAFQVGTALLAIEKSIISPTINFHKRDKSCDINCVPNKAISRKTRNVLVTCSTPIGQSAALVISKNEHN